MGVLAAGDVLDGKYRLIGQLGSGGMGTVWRAEHLVLRSPVAVKLMHRRIADDPAANERFQREARAAAALRSPHVVSVLDTGVHDGAPFVVMELLEGESLDQRLRRVGRISLEQTTRVVTHVARALARAHEVGIVHRDLKPANVFLQRNADEEIGKVLDFGVAKFGAELAALSPLTQTGAVLGSPHYMSPEQARGRRDVDHRSDLWTLAIITFECVTGRRPFDSPVLGDLLLKICTDPVPAPSSLIDLPAGFDAWFFHATEREPDKRFQSALEMSDALRALVPASPQRAVSVSLPPPLPAPQARGPSTSIALVIGIMAFVLALVIVFGGAIAVWIWNQPSPAASVAPAATSAAPPQAVTTATPTASALTSAPAPIATPAKTASKTLRSAPTASAPAGSGMNPCVQACNKIRACAPTAKCDASGDCSGVKRALADCVNAVPCKNVMQCLP